MRHGDKINNLGRTASHRTALLCNLTVQLIRHKRLVTTLAKAKALRTFAEPIITRCKNDTMHNRRIVFSYLQEKEAIKELFGVISDKVADRPGGYTRIIKLPRRMGDASDMAMIELVDFNTIYGVETEAATEYTKKTRRSRRKSSKKADDATPVVADMPVVPAPVVEDTTIAPQAEEATSPEAEDTSVPEQESNASEEGATSEGSAE
ncbi:MAG: 50S ribosomal protein L17 [Chitinophagia bacterium]|nr:50S ribosomal protein L17 [Chitinophagia bacterium]